MSQNVPKCRTFRELSGSGNATKCNELRPFQKNIKLKCARMRQNVPLPEGISSSKVDKMTTNTRVLSPRSKENKDDFELERLPHTSRI